jgi:hypothetical protein
MFPRVMIAGPQTTSSDRRTDQPLDDRVDPRRLDLDSRL